MKRKLHALLLLLAMAAGLLGFVGNQPLTNVHASKASANELLNALPASDVIIYVNAQKILNETLPTFLDKNPNIMTKLRKELEDIKNEVGIDLNTIDYAAVGMTFKTKTGGDNVIAIVRGRFNSTEAVNKGLANAEKQGKSKRHETVYEGRTIFSLKHVATNSKSKDNSLNSKEEVAVVVLDSSTIAVGDMQGVRAVIDAALGRNKVSDELVALATRNTSALISFSGNAKAIDEVPAKMGNVGGQFLDDINQFYGALWTSTNDVEGQLTLRTNTTEKASDLRDALNGLKMLFSGMSGGKGDHEKMIKEVLNGVTINSTGNEVDITGKVSNSNISVLLNTF